MLKCSCESSSYDSNGEECLRMLRWSPGRGRHRRLVQKTQLHQMLVWMMPQRQVRSGQMRYQRDCSAAGCCRTLVHLPQRLACLIQTDLLKKMHLQNRTPSHQDDHYTTQATMRCGALISFRLCMLQSHRRLAFRLPYGRAPHDRQASWCGSLNVTSPVRRAARQLTLC